MRRLVRILDIVSTNDFGYNNVHQVLLSSGNKAIVPKSMGVGTKVVYFDYDALLPIDKSPFDKIAPLVRGKGRVRAISLGNLGQRVHSHGLALSINDFPELDLTGDLEQQLGVKLWESSVKFDVGQALGVFPSFIINKTDEENHYHVPNGSLDRYFRIYQSIWTIKLHGTSCSVFMDEGETYLCSRNLRLRLDVPSTYHVALSDNVKRFIKDYENVYGLQGEIIGWDICDNPFNYPKNKTEFFVFNIVDLYRRDIVYVDGLLKQYGIPSVPVVGHYGRGEISYTTDELTSLVEGKFYDNTNFPLEGYVIRWLDVNNRVIRSVKVINPDYRQHAKGG